MQALSYLQQVQEMLREDGNNFVANKEERARVESLVGQVSRQSRTQGSFLRYPAKALGG